MNDQQQFLQTVLDTLRHNEGTPALVYADWLEENGGDYPEFFRLLGRKAMEYPDWLVTTGTATFWGGGYWSASTTHSRYIRKTLNSVAFVLGREQEAGGWIAFSRQTASAVASCMEIADMVFSTLAPNMNDWERYVWGVWGLPNYLYGHRLHVFDTPVVPDHCAVILNEKTKTLALVTEVG